MLDRLADIENTFIGVERQISDPEVIADQPLYEQLIRQHADLKDGVELYRKLKELIAAKSEAEEMSSDPELGEMAKEELAELTPEIKRIEDDLQLFLLPKDPDDKKNAVVEVRSGTGGDEASLFAGDLYRMYVRFAESKGWSVELMDENVTGLGGVKEVVFVVSGAGAYSHLKFESGTHRVQRVPDTESSGRVHTSAATVAIMPEAEDVDITIDTKDLRIDTYRASGAGGQHVNKTDSAVRITHEPTGVVVACQDERSQFQNKEKAMRLLRTKLYEQLQKNAADSAASLRKQQVGSGDRSEKIRTYNFPQSRVTDHRIGLTMHCLDDILSGARLGDLIDELVKADRLAKLNNA